eukprot:54742-Eustigmatos_ZCMA.PRE.1
MPSLRGPQLCALAPVAGHRAHPDGSVHDRLKAGHGEALESGAQATHSRPPGCLPARLHPLAG